MNPVRFALVFGAWMLAGFGLLLTPPAQAVDARLSQALVTASHGILHACGSRAFTVGAILRDPGTGFAVEMKDGCNGVNVTILLWAAMLAFPARWKWKIAGLAAGSIVIQALNMVRFISLFYIGQYSMSWFDFAHAYLWESLLVLDSIVIFWLWAKRVSVTQTVSHA